MKNNINKEGWLSINATMKSMTTITQPQIAPKIFIFFFAAVGFTFG
jgi:hypothetical protein